MSGKVRPPKTHDEWRALIQEALRRAERSNDRRVAGLRQAFVSGNIEAHLRKMGIISPEDLSREFPDKKLS